MRSGRFSGAGSISIIFLIIMAFNTIQGGMFDSPADWLKMTLMRLPGIVIGITVHEFAHAFSAYKLGDMTPKAQGRVTLNPLAHIEPIGIIMLIFIGFGWGRPVQVNPYAFPPKRMRLSNLITDIAGVTTNFILAFLIMPVYLLTTNAVIAEVLYYLVFFNIILMIFNLLPIPPLDGFGIITEIFNLRRFGWYRPIYENGSLILLALIVFGATSKILLPVLFAIWQFIFNFWVGILF